MAGQAAGLKPSTFTEGGGLPGDIDVVFSDIAFAMWDYNGAIPTANPAIMVKMQEESGEEHIQYWSAGQAKDWTPSEDGKMLVAVGSATGINVGSNAGLLLTSIVNAGFPEEKIGDDITVFKGMKCHVIRQPAPKRNIVKQPRADGRVFEDTVLVVSKILQLPWERKGAPAAKSTTKPSGDGSDGGNLEDRVMGLVLEVLTAEGKPIPKQQLFIKVFQIVKTDPDRDKIIKLVHSDQFLSSGPLTLKGGVVSVG